MSAAQDTDVAGRLELVIGDITAVDVDAVVNAANAALKAGGGVDGAIHRRAGPALQRFLDATHDGCPTGECRISPGFGLKARHIIHCVGPVWRGGGAGEDAALASCYARALEIADRHGLASVAFPAISTGIYGFPPERAAPIAVATVTRYLSKGCTVERVIFVCFDERAAAHYKNQLAARPEGRIESER